MLKPIFLFLLLIIILLLVCNELSVGIRYLLPTEDITTENFFWNPPITITNNNNDNNFVIQQQQIPPPPVKNNNNDNGNNKSKEERPCALLFFGLPRAFRTVVLPSIVKNVLQYNINCDIYVHYYRVEYEERGRAGKGGIIEVDAVDLLREEVNKIQKDNKFMSQDRIVEIIYDTDKEFWLQRNETIQKFRTTIDNKTGKYLYFPWKDKGYRYPGSMDNIVKQWHSINAVFQHMELTSKNLNIQYQRLAMLRLDVFYATKINIIEIDKDTIDVNNQYCIAPGFGKFPVNDRLFYGPYDGVKIWSTERFTRIEQHVRTYEAGYGMHSERFMNYTIFPAINALPNITIKENIDICVMRARADNSIWSWDCNISIKGGTRGFNNKLDKKKLIENILERNCTETTLPTGVKPVTCTE